VRTPAPTSFSYSRDTHPSLLARPGTFSWTAISNRKPGYFLPSFTDIVSITHCLFANTGACATKAVIPCLFFLLFGTFFLRDSFSSGLLPTLFVPVPFYAFFRGPRTHPEPRQGPLISSCSGWFYSVVRSCGVHFVTTFPRRQDSSLGGFFLSRSLLPSPARSAGGSPIR